MKITRIPRTIAASLAAGAILITPVAAQPLGVRATSLSDRDRHATCPLTGTRRPADASGGRVAVAVKVDNTPGRTDQRGLENADVVIEHPVEGGMTRFSAIFHCNDAARVGPVRSARIDDGRMLDPVTNVLAYSGANRIVARELNDFGLISVTKQGLTRDRDLEAPFNLFADTRAVRKQASDGWRPGKPFTFGPVPRKAKRTDAIEISFGGATAVSYRWVNGAWRRSQDGTPVLDSEGKRLSIENVLIQEVTVDESANLYDSTGNPSPEMRLDGRGRALLFRDGAVIAGTWRSRDGAVEFRRPDGSSMPFDVGQTWWGLLPSAHGAIAGSISF